MTPPLQTIFALALVALTVTWLVWRTVGKKKKAGCGGECDCTSQQLKR